MTTPTNPMKHAPSQQGHGQGQGRTPSGLPVATPPVSTPFSASHAHAFSPRGPKSSPQQFKKSPANSATLMGHPGNGPTSFDSPSAAAAMGALGMGGGLDMGLDNVAVGGLSALGGMSGEDERVKRLDGIIGILGKAKGRVSEAGLERLSQRTGLNRMWEEQRTPDGRVKKTLVVAGHGLQLDINLENNVVQSVTLAFPESESTPIVAKHADKAGQILFRDLALASRQSPLTKKLEGFAANLERLATLDKLSMFPGLDCQEAVAGIFESLDKLYKWELSKLREDGSMNGKPDRSLDAAIMCSRSGRPAMHVRDHVGLSLDYWVERRLAPPTTSDTERYREDSEKTWSILMSCKALDGELYHAIRVSENWISSKVEKPDPSPQDLLEASNNPVLDWLEPEPTVLPQNSDNKDVGVDVVQPDGSTQKFPNVKFVALFNPPVIVPQAVSSSLYGIVGAQHPPMLLPSYTYDSISFPVPEGVSHDASELRTITCERDVPVPSKGADGGTTMGCTRHQNTLFIYKPVYGQTISELPFSHPRQLVAMLPTLRQYALISTLLARSFNANVNGEKIPAAKAESDTFTRSTTTAEDEFQEFMAGAGGRTTTQKPGSWARAGAGAEDFHLDVVLTVHPTAGLAVVFPFRDATANVDLQIQQNGVIHIASQNILPEDNDREQEGDQMDVDEGAGASAANDRGTGEEEKNKREKKRKKMKPQDLGRLLEVFEDLCQWAEWIRLNLS